MAINLDPLRRGGWILDPGDQGFHRALGHAPRRLADRRQIISWPGSDRHIVKADYRHIARNVEAEFEPQNVHDRKRHMIIGNEDRVGASLARLEAQEAILGLMRRYPDLSHSERGFHYHAIPSFRGMDSFWVKAG